MVPPARWILFATIPGLAWADTIDCDICVYGGTAGGVAASLQASRMGKSAVLVEPGRHLGGMTSGGLGRTDTGNPGAIGGLSDEFYRAVGAHYGGGRRFTFEPHVAEEIFNRWISTAGVRAYFESQIATLTMDGPTIRALHTSNGHSIRAKVFIDATYEGDLMALAGVSYTIGRESNAQYGETLNGVRSNTPSHQFVTAVDPWVVPGNSASGLLPYVQPGDGGTPGSGDAGVQAYNFRLCLTQDPANRIPIAAPSGYDPAMYELLGRYVAQRVANGDSLALRDFMIISGMPNGKTDINNRGAFSTDFIGQNYAYPDGSSAERAQIWEATRHYIHGFLYFLGHDPRIPANVRNEMLSWGLCRDEFQDTGGWPHQMYVREARRMVSDYVMTELNCRSTRTAPNSIGLGSYTMDSHNIQRIVQNGVVRNEGDVQAGVPRPYPIAYASIVPRQSECDNLFVTFCLSASHIAFGSCRMEPVHMITSQSAATAAAFAIDDDVPIQQVDYEKLAVQLRANAQILTWGSEAVDPGDGYVADSEDPAAEIVGDWSGSTSVPGYAGSNYLHDGNVNKGAKTITLRPNLPANGSYDLYLRWTAHSNRASNVPVTVLFDGGSETILVNQREKGSQWILLGTWPFLADDSAGVLIETTGTDGYVIADAALWIPEGTSAADPNHVFLIASDPDATEGMPSDPARLLLARTGPTTSPLTVPLLIEGSATPELDYPSLPSSLTFTSGESHREILIYPPDDHTAEGDESLLVTLGADPAYLPGSSTAASITLHDAPFDAWRFIHFTPLQLLDDLISGTAADPESDDVPNIAEFFANSNPWLRDPGLRPSLSNGPDGLFFSLRRTPSAATLRVTLESSLTLDSWTPVTPQPPFTVRRESPWEILHYPVDPRDQLRQFWRARIALPTVPTAVDGLAFYSFDRGPDGEGAGTTEATLLQGYTAPPLITLGGSVVVPGGSGGAANFTGPEGRNWLGSGNSTTPGHSLGWNPGSQGNRLTLQLSTVGQKDLTIRFDLRSAQQPGGSAPTTFSAFTYNLGTGPQAIPGIPLAITADNQFHEWSADLSPLDTLENRPSLTLCWEFDDLASSPAESVRIDNLLIESTPLDE